MDKHFEQLLLAYSQAPTNEERERIEQALWKQFGHRKAIFVLDMSSFSLLTQKYGVVHYLSLLKRMQNTALPVVEAHQGEVVKFEADNCYAMFDDVLSAVQTSIELNRAFDDMNEYTDDPFDIRISIGIDFGDVLLIGGPDYFGDSVNRACKLGEDVAGPGEILLTAEAFEQLPKNAGFRGEALELSISGIKLEAVNLDY